MLSFCLFVTLVLPLLCVAGPVAPRNHVLHEKRDETTHLRKSHGVEDSVMLPLRIGLKQRNLDRAYDLLMEVSDPVSSKYGQHYSAEDIVELFAPANESVDVVKHWLQTAGVHDSSISRSANKQWIQIEIPVRDAETLLHTEYHYYHDHTEGRLVVGCDEYHVPAQVQPHIDYITPGIKTKGIRRRYRPQVRSITRNTRSTFAEHPDVVPDKTTTTKADSTSLAHCSERITPQCIMAMYNITRGHTSHPGNELGIFETEDSFVDQKDLNLYFTQFYPTIPNGTFPIFKGIDGAKNKDFVLDAGTEILDFEVSYPIIWPQNSILFQADDDYYEIDSNYTGFLNTFLDGIDGSYCSYSAFGETGDSPIDPQYPDPHKGGYKGSLQCGVYEPTNVISISYALAESGGGLPHNYEQRQCNEYMKLGLQGVTVVVASGDDGVASNAKCGKGEAEPSKPVTIPCDNGCFGKKHSIFNPNFPVSCPYVLAVGATRLPRGGQATNDEEVAATLSGGGFSNVFPAPAYQMTAIENYFNSAVAPRYPYYNGSTRGDGLYNRTGRGIPDVAAIGTNVPIYIEGDVEIFEGTSIATPVFAAVLNRVNEERLKAGKSTIGFVNPALYANPHALHDITSGHNPGCGVEGFTAGPGWDPVTGLGTPKLSALLEVFMKLP